MSGQTLRTLSQLHDAIVSDLRAHYRERVPTIVAYDPFPELEGQDPQPLITPAILLEVEAIDPGVEDGTDRQALRLTLIAHCVLSFRTEQLQVQLREFAADVLSHLRHQRWGLAGAVQAPEALAAQPGEFKPGLAGYDSWQARWEQQVYVGPDCWAGTGQPPDTVYLAGAVLTGCPL